MNVKQIRDIELAAISLESLAKVMMMLQSTEKLVFAGYDINNSCVDEKFWIEIPHSLEQEFRQKLMNSYVNEYNEYLKTIKPIEL